MCTEYFPFSSRGLISDINEQCFFLQPQKYFDECFLNDGHGLYDNNIGCQGESTSKYPLHGYVTVNQTCYNDDDSTECIGCVDTVCAKLMEYEICRQCAPGLRLETRTETYEQIQKGEGTWPQGLPTLTIDQVTACTRCPENEIAQWNECVSCPQNSKKSTFDEHCVCQAGFQPIFSCSNQLFDLDASAFVTAESFAKEYLAGARPRDYGSPTQKSYDRPTYEIFASKEISNYCTDDCRGQDLTFGVRFGGRTHTYDIPEAQVTPFCQRMVKECEPCPLGTYKAMVRQFRDSFLDKFIIF